MGASPTTAPAGAPATPPSPLSPENLPPDSTTADPASIQDTLEQMLKDDGHPAPGEPEPEPPAAAEPPAEEKPADAAPEFPEDDKEEKAASALPDEITFPDEEPEGEGEIVKADAEADEEIKVLLDKQDAHIAASGKRDKDLDDRLRGAFLAKTTRGNRMLSRDKYGRELEAEFGQLPEIKDLKAIRKQAEIVEEMHDDFHGADEVPGKAQTFLEYWLAPAEEGQAPALRPGAVSVIRSLPGFLAANPATAPLWYREIVPSVAVSLSDAFYAMSRKATNDRDKAGMHATAQWLDQHFLGKVRSQALDEPPKSRANGSEGKPDPEVQRIVAERDQLKQRLGRQETERYNGFIGTVRKESNRLVQDDIEHIFKQVKGQVAPRLFKDFTESLKEEIAENLAGDDDFYHSYERGVHAAHKKGDQGAIDRLSKTYRDKARAYLRKNYATLRADLVGGESSNGTSVASQKVAESEKRHAAHAKAQQRKGPEGGSATPGIRMSPVVDRHEGESKDDYLLRALSS